MRIYFLKFFQKFEKAVKSCFYFSPFVRLMNPKIYQCVLAIPFGIVSSLSFANDSKVKVENGILSGNIGVVSQYVYRGGVENDDLALQGGLEYAHKSGISIGYWGSTLDYDGTDETNHRGFEHDFYVSYGQNINEDWSYNLKTTAYVYHKGGTVYGENDDHRKTTGFDVTGELAYKNLSVATSVMLADASYANAGDTYVNIAYTHPLADDFALNTALGGSFYNANRDDSMIQTTQDFAFNEARVGVSKSFAKEGLLVTLDYVLGGENRLGEDFDNHTVLGLSYNF